MSLSSIHPALSFEKLFFFSNIFTFDPKGRILIFFFLFGNLNIFAFKVLTL